ncbi:unnamed protein product, partial [marine sediment metagenome]
LKMQIRKTYKGVSPELLYDEIRDFTLKQGLLIGGANGQPANQGTRLYSGFDS